MCENTFALITAATRDGRWRSELDWTESQILGLHLTSWRCCTWAWPMTSSFLCLKPPVCAPPAHRHSQSSLLADQTNRPKDDRKHSWRKQEWHEGETLCLHRVRAGPLWDHMRLWTLTLVMGKVCKNNIKGLELLKLWQFQSGNKNPNQIGDEQRYYGILNPSICLSCLQSVMSHLPAF